MTKVELARRIALLLALGLVLTGGIMRFQQAYAYRNVYMPDAMMEEGYYEAAIGLLSYQSFGVGAPDPQPRSWRGPIYPVFIALIESLSPNPNPGRVRLAQAALSSLSILLIFALGYAIYSPAAGLLAASRIALDPGQIDAVTSLNIHGFYSFLLWNERPTPKSTALAGDFLGVTLLCRSAHFFLIPLFAAAMWSWRPFPGRRGLALCLSKKASLVIR